MRACNMFSQLHFHWFLLVTYLSDHASVYLIFICVFSLFLITYLHVCVCVFIDLCIYAFIQLIMYVTTNFFVHSFVN